MGGMTDALLQVVAAAENSADSIEADLAAIADRYEALCPRIDRFGRGRRQPHGSV